MAVNHRVGGSNPSLGANFTTNGFHRIFKGEKMSKVKNGDTVRIHYIGRLEDGTVFDSSDEGTSLEFKVGDGEFLKGLEEGVVGMSLGESKEIRINEAYGPHNKQMVFEYDRKKAPENFNPEIGQRIDMFRADGMPIAVTVTGKTETAFIMDCNHPLAGKNLIFDIKVEEII
jgi:peptidylprolyl isomerase